MAVVGIAVRLKYLGLYTYAECDFGPLEMILHAGSKTRNSNSTA